ncbi:MAG TPA: hypothetical protein VFT22_10300 [Kofleriaceae bacterium]|nr:hypothetical protein [Kofleriaceae bacterium]
MDIDDLLAGVRLGRYRAELERIHDRGGLEPAVRVHMFDLASPDRQSWSGGIAVGERMIDLWLASGGTFRPAAS